MTVRQFAVIATIWLVILTIITITQQFKLNNMQSEQLNKQIVIEELIPIDELN